MGHIELTVVVPVFNEEDNVVPLFEEICTALDGRLPFEVIFVDDASTDGTAQVLKKLAERQASPPLRIIGHRQNAGQSRALLTGVQHATGDWIATMDGDGQNDPGDIPAMLAVREESGTSDRLMVVGWRQKRHDPWLRRLSSRVANSVRKRLLNDGTPDTGCGLKLFPRGLYLELPAFDHMHRFLPALARRARAEIRVVPVHHRERRSGTSKYGLFDRLWVGIVDLFGVIWLSRRGCVVDEEIRS